MQDKERPDLGFDAAVKTQKEVEFICRTSDVRWLLSELNRRTIAPTQRLNICWTETWPTP